MALCLGFKEKVLINETHPEIFTDEIIYFKILWIKIIEELEKVKQDVYMGAHEIILFACYWKSYNLKVVLNGKVKELNNRDLVLIWR